MTSAMNNKKGKNIAHFKLIQFNNLINKYITTRKALRQRRQIHLMNAIAKIQEINSLITLLPTTRPINRVVWQKERTSTFWEVDVPRMSDHTFKENFRMGRTTFELLCKKLPSLSRQDTDMRKAIPLEKRIAISMYALGSSAEYRSIGHLFGVGRTTVGEILREFCEAVWLILKPAYLNSFEPLTSEKLVESIEGFNRLGFPQCFGAIDGCHIEVRPPQDCGYDYYNFKGWYSTDLLAVVDYRYRFMFISVGAPGRVRDCSLYDVSPLKKMQRNSTLFMKHRIMLNNCIVPPMLIGDSAFTLSDTLMKPFPYSNNLSANEANFNAKLSGARRVVENAFGHLKARFRRIGKGLDVKIDNTNVIIKAACVLHNFLNCKNDRVNQAWTNELLQFETTRRRQHSEQLNNRADTAGVTIRHAIANYIQNHT